MFTNTVPTGPYRGAGRPEANYALERLVDEAARVTGIDPVRLRRRNLIPPKAIPYKTAVGTTYDSGDFAPILDKALALAHYAEFKKRRRDSFRRKKLRGIGISCFLEHAGALPTESAALLFEGDRLVLGIGVQNTGQGHATIYPRLVAAKLGIPAAQHRTPPWRHQSRPEGQPVGRLALHHDGRQRALSRGRPDAGEGESRSPPGCWKPPSPT